VLRAPSLIARAGFAALSRTPSLAPPRNEDDDNNDNHDKDVDKSVWARDYNDDDDNDDDNIDHISPPLLVARVQVARLADFGKTLLVLAEICFLRSAMTGQRWRWTLLNCSFEAVHLLSRVARMTADKLLMASLLNFSENLWDLRDGGFLIRQLENLLLQPGSGPRLRELRELKAAELMFRRQRAGLPEPSPMTEGEEPHGNDNGGGLKG
jgi:hypothetical protein